MNIIDSYWKQACSVSVHEAVEGTIERAGDVDDGSLERKQAQIDKAAHIIGFLAQKLADHGLMSATELGDILAYTYTVNK